MRAKRDAVPSRSRNPLAQGPRAPIGGWRGLTPRWPRSLRLGSASECNLTRPAPGMQPPQRNDPARCEKKRGAAPRAWWRAPLGAAYGCCDNVVMENHELSLRVPAAPAPAEPHQLDPATHAFGEPDRAERHGT